MKWKSITLLCLLLWCAAPAWAQYVEGDEEESTGEVLGRAEKAAENDRAPWRDRVFFGGNFWMQFGNFTFVELSPQALYRVNDKLAAGGGLTYIYRRTAFRGFVTEGSVYGARTLARYTIYRNVFAMAEMELLNIGYFNRDTQREERTWTVNPFIGGGVIFPLGNRGQFTVAAMYNLNHDPTRSFYPQPYTLRTGFNF
ncbi:MAG: hypothetical protein WBA12_06310 [Catalinimonas sp.]